MRKNCLKSNIGQTTKRKRLSNICFILKVQTDRKAYMHKIKRKYVHDCKVIVELVKNA